MKYRYIFLISFLLQGVSFAEMRAWHCNDGTLIQGEYIGRPAQGLFSFRSPSGEIQLIAATNLVANQLKYIQDKIPPKIEIQFRKKLNKEKGTYADPDKTLINGTLRIRKIGRDPFGGTLQGELYYIAKEVATDDHMMLAVGKFPIRFPDTEDQTVEFSMSAETRKYDEVNAIEIRGRNFEGYLAVVLGPSGEVLATQTDLKWLDAEEVKTMRTFHSFTFFDESCRKKSTPRMQYSNDNRAD